MSKVFISHASQDGKFVDRFVDRILRLGCGLSKEQYFYTSSVDAGVPLGEDLNSYIRAKATEAGLVIAIISPTYQARPYCIAELGAAWARAGTLFPLLVPGMNRTDLDGVLTSLRVDYINEKDALNQLHDKIAKMFDGLTVGVATWSVEVERWIASADDYAKDLEVPEKVELAEFQDLQQQVESVREALRQSEADRRKLEDTNRSLLAAKTAAEAREAMLPENEIERFELIRSETVKAFRKLTVIVQDALWCKYRGQRMLWPHRVKEEERHDDAKYAVEEGFLVEAYDDELDVNMEFPDIEGAYEAVGKLDAHFKEATPEFITWFRGKYKLPPDLTYMNVWREMVR